MKQVVITDCRLALAEYVGAVSRWCSLTGNVPEFIPEKSKASAELATFTQHLDYLAHKKAHTPHLEF